MLSQNTCLSSLARFFSLRYTSKQTTRKRVHLVRRGHFRSRDNDGGHTTRSAIAENPCCTQTSPLCLLQNRTYCRSKFYIAKVGNLALICCCDLDLDPMTFIHKSDQNPLKMYSQTKKGLRTSSFSNAVILQTDIHTDRPYYLVTKNITTPLRGWQ